MENYQGDLTDILRASVGTTGSETAAATVANWEFPSSHPITNQMATTATSFGDPFFNMQDPLLLQQLNNDMPGSSYFTSSPADSSFHHHHDVINTSTSTSTKVEDNSTFTSSIVLANHHHQYQNGFDQDEMMKSATPPWPCNIFSRIQISQTTSPAKLPVSPCDSPRFVVSSGVINANTSKDCLIESTVTHVQISSPPRNLGTKRRKSQARKVVCIPAPAAPNSRPGGEIVHSDLWAWRKYGQKPIKGSPYPRGYYRCSSSKGCSARKQVERSRNDPNMLVITYTSEHNHPWPTQRNALAGSTRSQPPKTSTTNSSKTSSTSHQAGAQAKEEQKESSSNDNSASLSPITPSTSTSVKEEIEQDFDKQFLGQNIVEFSDGVFQSYRPSLPPDSSSDQDFFADFGELEVDHPLSLLFTAQGKENKGMDPFNLFDWSSGDTHNTQFDNK